MGILFPGPEEYSLGFTLQKDTEEYSQSVGRSEDRSVSEGRTGAVSGSRFKGGVPSRKSRASRRIRPFFDYAERLLFAFSTLPTRVFRSLMGRNYQSLLDERRELLRFFDAGIVPEEETNRRSSTGFRFRKLKPRLTRKPTEGIARADQFAPYEKLRPTKRCLLLSRLDKLEMISVQQQPELGTGSRGVFLPNACPDK